MVTNRVTRHQIATLLSLSAETSRKMYIVELKHDMFLTREENVSFFLSLGLVMKKLTHLIVNFGFHNKSHSLRVFPKKASPFPSKVTRCLKHILPT